MDKQMHVKIVNDIVKILYDNKVTVSEAREILRIASNKVMMQKLIASS